CGLPPDARRAKSPGDHCVACHMPSSATSDIPHVATTVHSIPRRPPVSDPDERPEPESDSPPPSPDDTLLVPFHGNLLGREGRAAVKRDLGVALRVKGPRGAAEALPLLEKALAADPDDLPARESLGYVLGTLGRGAEGLSAFEAVLSRAPERESTL